MLRKYSNSRSFADNIKLGSMTALVAGMVNVASLVLFFSFASNVTGHFAILADEIANGRWFQVAIVFSWIFLFFAGSFISNNVVINGSRNRPFLNHSIPMLIETACLLAVGFYGHFYYQESLMETEILVAILLFSMGLQNGLTASISNFAVKTTHLTGLTTDLAIHLSMLTKRKFRRKQEIREKTKLLMAIAASYLSGGVLAGTLIHHFEFKVFFFASGLMMLILSYDLSKYVVITGVRRRHREKIRAERSFPAETGL